MSVNLTCNECGSEGFISNLEIGVCDFCLVEIEAGRKKAFVPWDKMALAFLLVSDAATRASLVVHLIEQKQKKGEPTEMQLNALAKTYSEMADSVQSVAGLVADYVESRVKEQ